ncbi:MAG TPA: DegV family protein [Anaerolineaceae bacterium]|nr:DegV family protein [Anaerolineaceae bacterium]HQM54998.1 DegV family protein [Anaerolineaceae bacterium]
MNKVMVVTDSTANIPPELWDGNPIVSVPLQVIWGNEILRDGVDIQAKEFYERLAVADVMPSTSQVTPEEFKAMYGRLIEEGYDILSIHISSKLSGTLDSAIQAKKAFSGARIELVDSLSTSMAMGFQVLSAARMAGIGATLEECKAVAEKAKANTGVYFVLNTLEFLHRGGRIGGAQAFLGTMLNMKPILELRDGRIEAVERVRTIGKATERLLDLVEQRVGTAQGPVRLCVVHANAEKEGQALLERAIKRFPSSLVTDAVLSTVSPVLGTHAGPGALGVAFMHSM